MKGKLEPRVTTQQRCALGEGVATGPQHLVAWVDITQNIIHVKSASGDRSYSVKSKATVIFRVFSDNLEFGSDQGIFSLNLLSGEEVIITNAPQLANSMRSNDGCFFDGRYFLGFMSAIDPEHEAGFIYCFDGSWHLIEKHISIPNTFVVISPRSILISDSALGIVWEYAFNSDWSFKSKTPWTKIDKGAPDGGVLIEDELFIAIWDGECIAAINIYSKERRDLHVPSIRPTNCAYDETEKLLWVTSATQGLTAAELRRWPLSGATFAFELNL